MHQALCTQLALVEQLHQSGLLGSTRLDDIITCVISDTCMSPTAV